MPESASARPERSSLVDEHFIVVAVRHTPEEAARVLTPLVLVRQAIHDTAAEHGLNVGDMVWRADRRTDLTGADITQDYGTIRDIYHRVMSRAKSIARASHDLEQARGRRIIDPEQHHRAHRARALRALAVVQRYETEHGDLMVPVKKGRHA